LPSWFATSALIGEVRDAVTAATAVHAANSGHLVLATLHAPVAAAAVQSLRGWGVNPYFLASSLLGVVAQRLVRTLCPECRTPFPLAHAPHTFAEVRRWLGPGEGESLFAARGCPACLHTGYVARTGVFEVLPMNARLRHLVAEGATPEVLLRTARQDGLRPLREHAVRKVASGVTSFEEAVRGTADAECGW
jgi:type II secretory ATPase GspE/PulE/Tfp pilus assembly ATPase PilB-like protein